jgi:hypothetical protein
VIRRLAGQHLVEQRAERVHVGALVHRLPARLLRGHVAGRAQHRALPRERAIHGERVVALGLRRALARRAQVLGETPVDHHRLAEGADQHVGRLEIAVDDAFAVGVRDGVGHGDDVGEQGQTHGERAGGGDDLVE